jgi:FAD/FMN-containing dehydrogenase
MAPRGRRKETETRKRGITIGRRVGRIGFMGRGMSAPSREKPDVVHALSLRIDEDMIVDGERERERCRDDTAPRSDLLRRLFSRKPVAVVFPRSGQNIADVLDTCIEERAPAVPRGLGSVGLGGAVPLRGGVVVDLSRMGNVVSVDRKSLRVTVEAGCTWTKLRDEIASENLSLRSYPSNPAGGTVGGWVSTGGYGVGTLADGRFDRRLESLEVAVPSGLLVNAGHGGGRYSIESFSGTEGQLGIIAGLTFSVKERPECRVHYVMGPVSVEKGVDLLTALAGLDNPPTGLRLLAGGLPALLGDGSSAGERGSLLALLFEGTERDARGLAARLGDLAGRLGVSLRDDESARSVFETSFTDVADGGSRTFIRSGEVLIGLDRLVGFIQAVQRESGGDVLVDTQVVDRGLALVMTCYLRSGTGLPPVLRHVHLTVKTSLAAIRFGGLPYGVGIWNSPFSKSILGKKRAGLAAIKSDTDRLKILNPGKFFSLTTSSGLPVWGWTYKVGLRMIGVLGEGGAK